MSRTIRHSLARPAVALLLLLLAVAVVPAAADPGTVKTRRADAGSGEEAQRDVRIERIQIPKGELLRGPRGFLGVHLMPLNAELRAHFGVPEDAGALVAEVVDGSPAEKAGIKVGDILTRLDGDSIEGTHDVRAKLRDAEDGATATIEIYRDGKPQTVTATLERRERSEVDLAPFFIRDGEPGERMILRLDPEKMGEHLETFELPLGANTRLLDLRGREKELEKRLAELEKRLKELEKQLQR